MPEFKPTERIEVYALKAPVFEFKFGDLLGKFVSIIIFVAITATNPSPSLHKINNVL